MPSPSSRPTSLQQGDPRLIVQWARRYAKSRTISFLVQWVVIVCMVVAIGIAASLTHMAYRAGSIGLFSLSVLCMVAAIIALTWFSLSPWGGELIWRVTRWLYGREGYVAYHDDQPEGPGSWWLTALGGGLVVYHLVGALLVSFGYLNLHNMQPFSALYMAPFLIFMILYQRLGFWAWIWPLLYAAHAVLLLLDAPIAFRGQWQLLNMVVPVFGYGLFAILIGHLYSRFALYQLKRLARAGLDAGPGANDDEDPSDTEEPAP